VPPGRTVRIARTRSANRGLTMCGDSYRDPASITSEVQAQMEVVEKTLPEDTALRRPAGEFVTLLPLPWNPGGTTGSARSALKTRISCLPAGGVAW